MAIPVFEAVAQTNSGASSWTNMTATAPSGITSGELLLIVAMAKYNGSVTMWTTPSGWTKHQEYGDDSNNAYIGLFWKQADGTEGNVVVPSTTSSRKCAHYIRISGADTVSPFDGESHVIDVSSGSTVGSSLTGAKLVTTVADTLCLATYMVTFDWSNVATLTHYAGWTEESNLLCGASAGTSFGRTQVASKGAASSGDQGLAYVSLSTNSWGTGYAFAIKSATPVTVNVTGVSATGSPGTSTATGDANTAQTGIAATGSAGSVTEIGEANVFPSGVSATASHGTATINAQASVAATGIAATGGIGSATVTGKANIFPTGIDASGEVGLVSVTAGGSVSINVTGFEITASLGNAEALASATTTVTGLGSTAGIGSVTISEGAGAFPTGLSATGEVGEVLILLENYAFVPVIGLQATGIVGDADALDWHVIVPGEGSGYTIVSPTNSPNWKEGSMS